jgi:hypothetical protein
MIRAIYRNGAIEPLDDLPADWQEGQELCIDEASKPTSDASDRWLADLDASAAQIPERVHVELAAALDRVEAESKELGRREMERSS